MSAEATPELTSLLERIDRLESLDQIRQLPPKYALALDQRDIDALVNLFVEDVGVPGKQRGRAALKRWYVRVMRELRGTAHNPMSHIIDFESPELASGIVYSRNDKEHDEVWEIEMMLYLDRYERRDGIWYFQRRAPLFWYQTPLLEPALGDDKLRMLTPWSEGGYHSAFPTWQAFWENQDYENEPVAPPAPLYRFLEHLRRGEGVPRVNPAGQKQVS